MIPTANDIRVSAIALEKAHQLERFVSFDFRQATNMTVLAFAYARLRHRPGSLASLVAYFLHHGYAHSADRLTQQVKSFVGDDVETCLWHAIGGEQLTAHPWPPSFFLTRELNCTCFTEPVPAEGTGT